MASLVDQPTSSNSTAADAGKDLRKYYLPFFTAIKRGDLMEAEKFLDIDKEARTAVISEDQETALHAAMELGRKSNEFVRKLLESMPSDVVVRKNSYGNTAMHLAAIIGNKEAVMMLVNQNPNSPYILSQRNQLPVHLAAVYCHKETLVYLISISKKDVENSPFVGELGATLLGFVIASHFIDVALYLVQKYPELATLKSQNGIDALYELARSSSVFESGAKFSWWQKWIYSRISLTSTTKNNVDDIENQSFNDGATKKFNWSQIACTISQVKNIKDKKVLNQEALELTKCVCKALESLPSNDASKIYRNTIIMAAQRGNHEVVEMIIDILPSTLYTIGEKTKENIFHIAARQRFENVFKLIYQIGEKKHFFYDNTDSSDNNYMHVCGEQAPPHKLNLVSGAALQMQRELQWFKEMEKFVHPSRRTWLNKAGKTPQMVFTENHTELKSQGEKWMKTTATSCTIAAALIATVVFTVAFTVPGGVDNNTGIPIFLKKTPFIIFAISDSISLFTSITSLLMFLAILTSRYAEEDFLHVLPHRLCIGLLTLFTSIIFMIITFSTAIYMTLDYRSSLFSIPVAALACLPVASFVFLQSPLLIDVMYSTYGPGIFVTKNDRKLF